METTWWQVSSQTGDFGEKEYNTGIYSMNTWSECSARDIEKRMADTNCLNVWYGNSIEKPFFPKSWSSFSFGRLYFVIWAAEQRWLTLAFLLNVITRRFHRSAQHPAQTFPTFVVFSSISKKGFLLPKICWQEHKPGKAPDNPFTQFPLKLHFFSFGLHLQPKSMHISVSYHVT